MKILYVDDEELNRAVFAATFQDEFDVICVDGGEAALAVLETEPIAAIVSDQRMPEISGNQLLARVRDEYPRVIRMVVTGYSDVDAILTAVNQGLVSRYVVKPWEEDAFRETLRWALQAHGLGRDDASVQARLLEAERFAALGEVQASFLHEVGRPVAHILSCSEELVELASSCPDLLSLAQGQGAPDQDQEQLLVSLLESLPEISADLLESARFLHGLRDDVRRLLYDDPPDVEESTSREVRRAIDFCLAMNRIEASKRGIRLRYCGPSGPPALRISPARLMQVLINLTRNAVLSFGEDETTRLVEIDAQVEASMAIVLVSDTGPGMSEQVRKRLGQQFYSTRASGSGLGVYRCRTILEGLGGSLTYHSTPGEGTHARAAIPLARPAS